MTTSGRFWVIAKGLADWLRLRLRKAVEGSLAFRQAFKGGARDAAVEGIAIVVVALTAWACFIPVVIYEDHEHQVELVQHLQSHTAREKQLKGELTKAQEEAKEDRRRRTGGETPTPAFQREN